MPSEAPAGWWTRFVFLRSLGLLYAVGFLILVNQGLPLIGHEGLLPMDLFLDRVSDNVGGSWAGFAALPSVFWFDASDAALMTMAWLGLGLSVAVMAGVSNGVVMAVLWFLYMSFVHVGQRWYGYGWEILLLETGFLAIFLCPLRRLTAFSEDTPPPTIVLWLLRWLAFRLMFGAGLIKLRGDPCWTDLSCLVYHYETQPNPHPLSWVLHHAPTWFHEAGVLLNHGVELIAPWFLFGPRRVRQLAALSLVLFQVFLILSGNLAFLNWMTLVVCLACFDDTWMRRVIPARWRDRAPSEWMPVEGTRRWVVIGLAVVVGILSIQPVTNMLSPRQVMNTSFDRLHLVNTYGAFGSVGKTRYEVVLQGTNDPNPGPDTEWLDYELPCKPGRVDRRPCVITPYHLRLDWQIWFAAMEQIDNNPWLVHLVAKLLSDPDDVADLISDNPFPDGPPAAIRIGYYRYAFSEPGSDVWWDREWVGEYLRPLTRDDETLQAYVTDRGWAPRTPLGG